MSSPAPKGDGSGVLRDGGCSPTMLSGNAAWREHGKSVAGIQRVKVSNATDVLRDEAPPRWRVEKPLLKSEVQDTVRICRVGRPGGVHGSE
jgi:hypothetical protein